MSSDADERRAGWPGPGMRVLALVSVGLAATMLVAACGSGSGRPSAAAVSASCTQVSAMLSDGPDPGSDPVGYAEAQIKPLRALPIPDAGLRGTVDRLADAYAAVFASNDASATAKSRLATAIAALNRTCPNSGAGL